MAVIASSMPACSRLMGTIHSSIRSRKSSPVSSQTSAEGSSKNRPRTGRERFQERYRQISDSWLMGANVNGVAAVELAGGLGGVPRNMPPESESIEALDPEKAAIPVSKQLRAPY